MSEKGQSKMTPTIHDLKCWPSPFEEILSGMKRFEFRKNDRDFKIRDLLILNEWNPDSSDFTGRACEIVVLSVANPNT